MLGVGPVALWVKPCRLSAGVVLAALFLIWPPANVLEKTMEEVLGPLLPVLEPRQGSWLLAFVLVLAVMVI